MQPLKGRSFARDEQGGVAIIAAFFGLLLCGIAALAVDLGSVVLTTRKIQGAADLAAMSSARDLARAQAAGVSTASANLPIITQITVKRGRYTPDPQLTPDARFTEQATDVNAARVEITSPAPLFFGRFITGSSEWQITRRATAALPDHNPRAMFSIGSRLAGLDKNAGIANALLSGLLGSSVDLSLLDYESLLKTDINLLEFSDLLATEVGVTAGDYDALLKHDVTTGQVLKVLEVLADGRSKSVLGTITKAPLGATLNLASLIGVDADARRGLQSGLDADVSLADLMFASLETANGDRQLQLDVGADLGLADLTTYVAIGQRPMNSPWLTITDRGSPIVRTAAARVYLGARVGGSLLPSGKSKDTLGLLNINVPVLVEVAPSEAKLNSMVCTPQPRAVIAVRPGLAEARIGKVDLTKLRNFAADPVVDDAVLVSVALGLVQITAKAKVTVGDLDFQNGDFDLRDVGAAQPRRFKSKNFATGLITSLLGELKLGVKVLGLTLFDPANLLSALGVLLKVVGPLLDAVLQPLLELLGLRLGEADIRLHALQCANSGTGPRLVG